MNLSLRFLLVAVIFYIPFALPGQSAVLTQDFSDEGDIRSGGGKIRVELSGDTLNIYTSGIAQDIIDGISSSGGDWNKLDNALSPSDVGWINDSLFEISLPAVSDYYIDADETLTMQIPTSAVRSSSAYNATPDISISNLNTSISYGGTILSGTSESDMRSGGRTLIIIADYNEWDAPVTDAEAAAMFSGSSDFSALLSRVNEVVDVNGNTLTITFPADADYFIGSHDNVTVTVPQSLFNSPEALTNGSTSFTITNQNPVVTLQSTSINEQDVRDGNQDFLITVLGDRFVNPVDNSLRNDFSGGPGWESFLEGTLEFRWNNSSEIRVRIPANENFQITAPENTILQLSNTHLETTSSGSYAAAGSVSFTTLPAYSVISRGTAGDLTERNLNGAYVYVKIYEDNFINDGGLAASNFTLNTSLPNLTINDVFYIAADSCIVVLSYPGDDFDTPYSLSISIDASELVGSVDIPASNTLPISYLIEPEITDVSVPDAMYGIGDVVTVTITVAGNSEPNYEYRSGAVALRNLVGFSQTGPTTYTARFDVNEGDPSYGVTDPIPVNNLMLRNPNGFVDGVVYNTPETPGTVIDCERPVIYSIVVNGGVYRVGETLTVVVTADQTGYIFDLSNTSVNGIPLTTTGRVQQGIVSGNQYYINYTIGEGDTDLFSGPLPVQVTMIDPVGNANLIPYGIVTGVNPIIDAHSPVLNSVLITDPGVRIIGSTVEMLLTFSEGNISALPGTHINNVPLGPRVTFTPLSGNQYNLTYTVNEGDQRVDPGNLTWGIVFEDAYGNGSSSSLNPSNNTVSIYATRPTGTLSGGGEYCKGDSTLIFGSFTGTGPWDITLVSQNGFNQSFNAVTNPFSLYVKPTLTDKFSISSIRDVHGNTGTDFGNDANVTVNQATPVSILNTQLVYLRDQGDPYQLSGDPSEGIFSGMGVESSTGLFYPDLVDTSNVTTVTYNYINIHGCASSASKQFIVIDEGHEFNGLTSGEVICSDDSPKTVSATNESGQPGSFLLFNDQSVDVSSTGLSDLLPGDDEVIILPGRLENGIYNLEYTYTYNGRTYKPKTPFFLNKIENLVVTTPETVCANQGSIELTASPNSDYPTIVDHDFDGPGVVGNISSGYFFNPLNASVGSNLIRYSVTSNSACSKDTSFTIEVLDVPDLALDVSSICIPVGGGDVAMINQTNKTDLVKEWYWRFDDINSGTKDTSTLFEPVHYYNASASRDILLRIETNDGCVEQIQKNYEFADKPIANFSWKSDCFNKNQGVIFLNNSHKEDPWVSHKWLIYDEPGNLIHTETQPDTNRIVYQFEKEDDYQIRLICETDKACIDTLDKLLVLKPTLEVTPDDSYYETFDSTDHRWDLRGEGLTQANWMHGEPDFNGYQPETGNLAWYTDIPKNTSESSWVQSPCFDLSALERPLIRLDVMKSFDGKRDGAVIQYTTNDGENWKTLGYVNDGGVNWYNVLDIINGPGGSSVGWSGTGDFNPDTEWVSSAHGINELIDERSVIFRIAYASDAGSVEANQGFAFDNIFIGERTRKTVLEHFTSSASNEALSADATVDKFITGPDRLDVLTLQYHTAYAGSDPMNLNNPFPASSRSFNYGITEVPFAVMDGGYSSALQYDFGASVPGSVDAKLISLEKPQFNMHASGEIDGGIMNISVEIISEDEHESRDLLLHTVVAEHMVTGYVGSNGDTAFRNVVLDMVPDPAGKLIGKAWYYRETMTENFNWTMDYYEDEDDIIVVSFLQERQSGKILQATQWSVDPLLDVETPVSAVRALMVYPNPATKEIHVDLGELAGKKSQLEIVDMTGRVVQIEKLAEGTSHVQLEIDRLNKGIYFLNWIDKGVLKGRSKLIKTD